MCVRPEPSGALFLTGIPRLLQRQVVGRQQARRSAGERRAGQLQVGARRAVPIGSEPAVKGARATVLVGQEAGLSIDASLNKVP